MIEMKDVDGKGGKRVSECSSESEALLRQEMEVRGKSAG